MAKKLLHDPESESWKLNERLTRFTNAAFGRRLRPSRSLHEAIISAEEAGYTHDEMRLAFWVARCIAGEGWLKVALQKDLSPEIVLRHKGHTNPKTGQPARRWLDDLVSRANETSPALVGGVLRKLPPDMNSDERDLLLRMEVPFEE